MNSGQKKPSEIKENELVKSLDFLFQYTLIEFPERPGNKYINPPKNIREQAAAALKENPELKQYIRMASNNISIEVTGELLRILEENNQINDHVQIVGEEEEQSADIHHSTESNALRQLTNNALGNQCDQLNKIFSQQENIPDLTRNVWQGNTLLLTAIANGSFDFALRLLDNHDTAHIHTASIDFSKCTPLTLCFSKGFNHLDSNGKSSITAGQIAKKLVEKGANIHGTDKHNRTALHYACLHRDLEAIQILISQGASWNSPDINGQTPLDFLFYDFTTASDILSNVTGGHLGYTFTLDEGKFSKNHDDSLLFALLSSSEQTERFIKTANENAQIRETLKPLYEHAVRLAEDNGEHIYTDYMDDTHPASQSIAKAREFYKIYLQLLSAISSINVDNSVRLQKINDIIKNLEQYNIGEDEKFLIKEWETTNKDILMRPAVTIEVTIPAESRQSEKMSSEDAKPPEFTQHKKEKESLQSATMEDKPSSVDLFIRKHADKRSRFSSTHLGLYQNITGKMIIDHAKNKSSRTFQVLKEMDCIDNNDNLKSDKITDLNNAGNNSLINEFIQKHVASKGLFLSSHLGLYEHLTPQQIIDHAMKSKANFFKKNRTYTILKEMKVIDDKGIVTDEKQAEFTGKRLTR